MYHIQLIPPEGPGGEPFNTAVVYLRSGTMFFVKFFEYEMNYRLDYRLI